MKRQVLFHALLFILVYLALMFAIPKMAFGQSVFSAEQQAFLKHKWCKGGDNVPYASHIPVKYRTIEWWIYAEDTPVIENYQKTMSHRWVLTDLSYERETWLHYSYGTTLFPVHEHYDVEVKIGPVMVEQRPVTRYRNASFYEFLILGN